VDPRPERLVLVTGTGTEVGKTWVACRLARALRARGLVVAARKPAQSYDRHDDEADTDAGLLAHATGDHPVVVPEPGTLALAVAAILALRCGRRAMVTMRPPQKQCLA